MSGIEVLRTDAALGALAADWEALWRTAPDVVPFAAPHWLLPWWAVWGNGAPHVAVLRDAGRLLGLLPLYRYTGDGRTRLLPIGIGISDELGPLLSPDAPADAAARLLAAAVVGETACDLTDLGPASPLRELGLPPGWTGVRAETDPRPVLRLPVPEAGLEGQGTIPARALRKWRMNRNRAERAGGAAIRTATAATLDTDLATLIALHTARWTGRDEPGVLADPDVRRFHALAGPGLLAAGLLRLCVLDIAGQPAAAILALLGPGRIFFYLSGFDARFEQCSPGSLLLAAMLEEAIAEGRREADFLRGDEAYKAAWGAENRPNAAWHLRARH